MQKAITYLCLIALISSVSCANWAVIIAGSSGFWNYRHQADVFEHGLPAENIILFSYDDAANSYNNPFKGQLFNKPSANGVDVRKGCVIDYSGDDVTPENFLAVLKGDASGVSGGTGRVLQSTANDNVFLNFADHGASGLIAFPSSELYADDLLNTFKTMHSKNMYKRLVFYLEACESGYYIFL